MSFDITQITKDTWCISSLGWLHCFLAVGSESALLIDTGAGCGDLKAAVESITDKPYRVINTHGHFDHAGGNGQFGKVMLHPADFEIARCCNDYTARLGYVDSRIQIHRPKMRDAAIADVIPDCDYIMTPVYGGEEIDLGNRILEVIPTPGHTKGCICLLDRQNRLLFAGDMATDSVIIHQGGNGTDVETTWRSFQKMLSYADCYDLILRGHFNPAVKVEYLQKLNGLAEKMLTGREKPAYLKKGIRSGYCLIDGEISLWFDGYNMHPGV